MIARLLKDPRIHEAAAVADTFPIDPLTYLSTPRVDRMLLLACLKSVSDASRKAAEEAKKQAKTGKKPRRSRRK